MNTKKLLLTISSLCFFIMLVFVVRKPTNELFLHFFDVGQGDAIFLQYNSLQVLIDGGPDNQVIEQLRQVMPIGDRTIDLIILTHPDADHIKGLLDVLDSYTIGHILMPKKEKETSLYAAWEKKIQEEEIPISFITDVQSSCYTNDFCFHFLHPSPQTITHTLSVNSHSIVTQVQFGELSFLLPGDIEEEVELALIREKRLSKSHVLKSPHHGSKSSSTNPFLNVVRPDIVIIQSGKENRFGHPHRRVLHRYEQIGAEVLRNDQLGTIRLSTNGEEIWLCSPRLSLFPQVFGFHRQSLYTNGI